MHSQHAIFWTFLLVGNPSKTAYYKKAHCRNALQWAEPVDFVDRLTPKRIYPLGCFYNIVATLLACIVRYMRHNYWGQNALLVQFRCRSTHR